MENNKIKRTTNRAQFEKMVRLMKEQPDIAKNLTKTSPEVVLEFWQKLQDELNALGPPIKEIAEWKKIWVWSDYKSSLRKKLAHNKRELKGTGGGSNTQVVFTPLDEEVIQLVCLRDGVDGIMTANKFGVPHKRTFRDSSSHNSLPTDHILQTVEEFILSSSSLIENDLEMEVLNEGNEAQPEILQTKGPKQIKLLEKQIEIEQNLNKNIEKFNETHNQISAELNVIQKRIARAVEKLGDRQKNTNVILQAQLDESKRHNKKIEQLALEKNRIKEKILQIELKKLELDTKL